MQDEPPISETEIALAEIWKSLLGLDRVGRYDSFFSLGGHSLLAMQFINQVKETFNFQLPVKLLFNKPMLYDLAMHVDAFSYRIGDESDEIAI